MPKPIKHNIIGEQAWHVFEKDGVELKEECSVAEYDSLGLSNPPKIEKEGYTHPYSYKDWKYDTPSGRLEKGTYVEWQGQILVRKEDLKNPKRSSGVNDNQEYLPADKINEPIWL